MLDDKCHSDDLAQALRGNTKIIVPTIHKFFYILRKEPTVPLKDKTFAVLIDEAHSSTEGDLMRAVTHVLAGGKVEELPEETPEEEAGELLTTEENQGGTGKGRQAAERHDDCVYRYTEARHVAAFRHFE